MCMRLYADNNKNEIDRLQCPNEDCFIFRNITNGNMPEATELREEVQSVRMIQNVRDCVAKINKTRAGASRGDTHRGLMGSSNKLNKQCLHWMQVHMEASFPGVALRASNFFTMVNPKTFSPEEDDELYLLWDVFGRN